MNASPLASTRALRKAYGDRVVLHDLDFEVRPGELTLLMGPSGSGKSSLVSCLVGAMRPSSGHVDLCGHALGALSEDEIAKVRRHHVGFVFQTDNLFPALTAVENVAVGAELRGASSRDALHLARSALRAVGLADRLDDRPGKLSGGQRQRVAVARAVVGHPHLLVGDEVTAALDGALALELVGLLKSMIDASRGVLLVTHDPRLVPLADRVVELQDGALVSDRRLRRRPQNPQAWSEVAPCSVG